MSNENQMKSGKAGLFSDVQYEKNLMIEILLVEDV